MALTKAPLMNSSFEGNHGELKMEFPRYVNLEQAPFVLTTARKIYYNLLLDDAAGLLSASAQLEAFLNLI